MAKLSKKALELLNTPATRQDSIDVLNSQLAQNAYYNKLKKYTEYNYHKPYIKSEENYYKDIYKDKNDVKNELNNSRNILKSSDNELKRDYGLLKASPQELRNKAAQYIKYAKSEGKDKYHYLDLVTGALNFDAPFALYNSKIKPKGIIDRAFYDNTIPGLAVQTWEYDPLAVTPVDMLTPEQKKLKEKLYGPQSYSKGNVTNTNQTDLEKTDLEEIPYKQLKGLESNYNDNPKMYVTNSNKTKNKKVSLKEPEHFLDISEPDGKGTQRIYFDTRKQLEAFQKESPMLKTGSFSRAKIKPEVLEILKKKK